MSQNRYQLPDGKNWTREIEVKCARPVQDGVQTVKSRGIKNGYYFMYGTRIVGVLLRRTQILFHRNLSHEPIAQIENFFSHRVPLVWVALRKSTLLWLEQGACIQQFSLCELRRLHKRSNLPCFRIPPRHIKMTGRRKRARPFLSSSRCPSRCVKTNSHVYAWIQAIDFGSSHDEEV